MARGLVREARSKLAPGPTSRAPGPSWGPAQGLLEDHPAGDPHQKGEGGADPFVQPLLQGLLDPGEVRAGPSRKPLSHPRAGAAGAPPPG